MIPERTCIGCRRRTPQAELLRLALDTESGYVVADPQRRRPGRGAYVHRDTACIEKARTRKALQRALRASGCDGVLSELATTYAKTQNRD